MMNKKTFEDKCQQAFQQANIQIIINKKNFFNTNEIVNELNQLISIVNHMKEQINSTQILKIKSNEPIENIDTKYLFQTNSNLINDKRSTDENDEPRSSKRLRSSIIQWIPPSKQFITNTQSQSSSLFQFVLSLIRTIIISTESFLTDEHYHWLHRTINQYDSNYNIDKLNILIETACIVAKLHLVR